MKVFVSERTLMRLSLLTIMVGLASGSFQGAELEYFKGLEIGERSTSVAWPSELPFGPFWERCFPSNMDPEETSLSESVKTDSKESSDLFVMEEFMGLLQLADPSEMDSIKVPKEDEDGIIIRISDKPVQLIQDYSGSIRKEKDFDDEFSTDFTEHPHNFLSIPTKFIGGQRMLIDKESALKLAAKVRENIMHRRVMLGCRNLSAQTRNRGPEDGVFEYSDGIAPGTGCLDWYVRGRTRCQFDSAHQTPFMTWFEPNLYTLRIPHRILLIQAVGVMFRKGEYQVLPVLLKNGSVVGFYRTERNATWLPVLEIHSTTREHPFHHDPIKLVEQARAKNPDLKGDHGWLNEVRQKFYEEYAGDLFLARAALELASLPEIPATAVAKDWMDCFVAVGWRKHSGKNINFPLRLSPFAKEYYTPYYISIDDYRRDHLVPRECSDNLNYAKKMLTVGYCGDYTSHGGHIDYFPGFFDSNAALNHMLLIPGGSPDWMKPEYLAAGGGRQTIDRQEIYDRLFGPLLLWLKNPFKMALPDTRSTTSSTSMEDSAAEMPKSSTSATMSTSSSGSLTIGVSKMTQPKDNPDYTFLHNPQADLTDLRDVFELLQEAANAGQLNVFLAAEVVWSILVYRTCTVLTLPPSSWIKSGNQAALNDAERAHKQVVHHFLNTANDLYRGRKRYSTPDVLTRQECFSAFQNIALGHVGHLNPICPPFKCYVRI